MTELEIPRGALREYLIVFGVAAVYVATAPSGRPCEVGVTRDLERKLEAIRARWDRSIDITLAYWVRDRESAKRIARQASARLAHDRAGHLDVTAASAGAAIRDEAAECRVMLTDHDAAMARVHAAVDHVADVIATAQANGGLKWFNRAYRDWRIEARAAGLGMSYAEACARLRRALVMRAVNGGFVLGPEMLPEIFPRINKSA